MREEGFRKTIRELVRCYQAFAGISQTHLRTLKLTPAQFDIIATLGGTHGLTPKQLVEKTLITKGTLTGVLDRLESQGLIRCAAVSSDRRSHLVLLTRKGENLFRRVVPLHAAHVKWALRTLTRQQHEEIQTALWRLRESIESARRAAARSR